MIRNAIPKSVKYVPMTPEDARIVQVVGRDKGRKYHQALRYNAGESHCDDVRLTLEMAFSKARMPFRSATIAVQVYGPRPY